MAEIVNLRQARKRKRRDEKQRAAGENRHAHGRSSVEKTQTRLSRSLDAKRLESHRRERPEGGEKS